MQQYDPLKSKISRRGLVGGAVVGAVALASDNALA
jgi:hypothetical protein